MTFAVCLARLQQEGVIDPERAARFGAEYDRLNRDYAKRMGKAAAEEQASRDAMDALERQAATDRRQALLQIQTQRTVLQGLTDHLERGGKAGQYAVSIMEHHEAVGGSIGVENRRGALNRLAWSRMAGFLGRYKRDLLGRVNNGEELNELVKVLRGESSTNPSAREMGAAVADTFEWLRQQFNMAGGDIPKLEGWGLPQNHAALPIAKDGFDTWWAFHRPLLDPSRMIDQTTGKAFASEEALREAGEAAWKNIASNGLDGQVPGAFSGQGKLANRRTDHRFFVYKDTESWLAYNERYGSGDVFSAIVGHIDSMTRDIAAMQALGPNPALTVRWLADVLRQDALPTLKDGKRPKLESDAGKGAEILSGMWDYYSGALSHVAPENTKAARFFSTLRNWNVTTKLGSAYLSAVATDPAFMGMTARFNGLPVMGTIGNWLKAFNPADASHRAAAEHAGLIFTEMTSRAHALYREGQGLDIHELSRRGADAMMRISLLTPHTVAAKQSLGLSFMKDWAEHAVEAFDQLAEPKRLALERYGIDAGDWDRLRALPLAEQHNIALLRPADLARTGGAAELETATKFMSLIDSETRFGIPGESLRAQAAVATFGNSVRIKRGTWGGELLHSANQFKTYSVIAMTTQLQRALYGRGGMSRLQYAIMLPTFLTIGGYIANALLDISKGQDPAPLGGEHGGLTLARAVTRGGGLGIIGDLLSQSFTNPQKSSGPVSGFLIGPTLGAVLDPAVSLTFGNLGQAANDKKTNWQAEAMRQLRGAVPGNNLWYARLAYNRLWADQLQKMVDPHWGRSFRQQRRVATQQGTEYWWAPGELSPSRAPDMSNIERGASLDTRGGSAGGSP